MTLTPTQNLVEAEPKAITVPEELSDIDKLIFLAKLGEKVDAATREYVWKVYHSGDWKEYKDTWREFVQEVLKKSLGWATKRMASHQRFVIEGGFSPAKLDEVGDTERLYLSTLTEGSPEEQFARALTWSRDDFKEDKKDVCEHPMPPITVCPDCWKQI